MEVSTASDVYEGFLSILVRLDPKVSGGHVRVKVNDGVCPFFGTYKGLRQGDPLPLILFNIVADMLAILFTRATEENQFKGIFRI
jgi:hypothetical protein